MAPNMQGPGLDQVWTGTRPISTVHGSPGPGPKNFVRDGTVPSPVRQKWPGTGPDRTSPTLPHARDTLVGVQIMWMRAWEDGMRWGGSVGGRRIWERIAASSPCGPRSTPSRPRPLMQACCVCARVSHRCTQTDTCNAHRVERQQVHWPHIESSPFTVCRHVKGTRDVLGGQDVRGQGPWHVGDVRDVFVVVAARHALRRGGAR